MTTHMMEAHFSGLPSQSSIYGMTCLCTEGGIPKVLVASLTRKVFCIEYSKNYKNLIPSTREVQFTYIPGGAEIISIDAFNKSSQSHDYVIGITFIKKTNNHSNYYFNIYSDWESGNEFDLDHIAQGCLSLELDITPYQLTHAEIFSEGASEIVWLLSGSDCKVHLYREDRSQQCFSEQPSSSFFPEFEYLPSIVYWIDIKHLSNRSERVTALGCENGYIQVMHVELEYKAVIASWDICHDGPISSLHLYTDYSTTEAPAPSGFKYGTCEQNMGDQPLHLLVGNTLETSVIYRQILKYGFKKQFLLPESDKFDCVTTACVADIDMDGTNEILLGTYGQEIMVYKRRGDIQDSNWTYSNDTYSMVWQRTFAQPLLLLKYVDVTGDGVKELLALSTKGLHILQHDLKEVRNLLVKRLKKVTTTCKLSSDM